MTILSGLTMTAPEYAAELEGIYGFIGWNKLHYVLISIFIGYLCFYLYQRSYTSIISWTSIKLGCISGFTLSTIAVFVGLISSNAFTWMNL